MSSIQGATLRKRFQDQEIFPWERIKKRGGKNLILPPLHALGFVMYSITLERRTFKGIRLQACAYI
jgi:hypothetical protein